MTASIPDERGQFEYVLVCGLDVTEQTWHDSVQGSLRRVATLVASGAGGSALMDAVTSEIGRLFEGQSANLLQLDGSEGLIAGAWSSGDALTWEVGTRFPVVGDTASGRAIESLRPERVDSPDELVDQVARDLWAAHGTQSTLAAPVIVDRALWGVISVSRVTADRFPAEAEERLGDFAALVAQAIANAAAQAEVRASRARLVATADAERKKLERNLHDGAQQRLVSISISLRLAQAKLQIGSGRRRCADRRRSGRAGARARRAARARTRHPSGRADRPRSRTGARRARRPCAVARVDRERPGRPSAVGGRGGCVLRRRRVADERGEVRAARARRTSASSG